MHLKRYSINTTLLGSLSFIIATLSACNTQQAQAPQPKMYSSMEYAKLTYCMAMADTLRTAAEWKKQGKTESETLAYYSDKAEAKLNTAIVKRVYQEESSAVWDYTVNFFIECGPQMSTVEPERMKPAAYCFQSSLISDVAYSFKALGHEKAEAYAFFSVFSGDEPKRIIDSVYSSNETRQVLKMQTWDHCMAPVADIM